MISVEKVVLNIGTGIPGEPIEKAEKLLTKITDQKPVVTVSKKRIPTWGVRKKMKIGTKVTLRGKKAEDFIKKAFEANDNVLNKKSISDNGTFAFGIREYIDIPGMKYDPDIGIFGMDVCVNLKRWGYRITKRKRKTAQMPQKHRITKEETQKYLEEKYKIKVEE